MRSTIKDAILKHLHIIYRHTLTHRWLVALLGGECQAKDRSLFEKQNNPCHSPPMVRSLKDRTREKPKNFIAALKKLYPDREHAPPLARP